MYRKSILVVMLMATVSLRASGQGSFDGGDSVPAMVSCAGFLVSSGSEGVSAPLEIVLPHSDGSRSVFKLTSQPEYEARVAFSNAEFSSNVDLAWRLLDQYFPQMTESMRRKTFGHVKVFNGPWAGDFVIAPLGSEFELYHEASPVVGGGGFARTNLNPRIKDAWSLKPTTQEARPPALPNEPLEGLNYNVDYGSVGGDGTWGLPARSDYIKVKHWVAWPNETAIYFDDQFKSLERSGWSARVKIWSRRSSPIPQSLFMPALANQSDVFRVSLTMKRSLGSQAGMTARQEYMIDLPLDFDFDIAPRLLAAVINKLESRLVSAASVLRPVKRVDTSRIGLNLLRRGTSPGSADQKVGFVTVDQYQRSIPSRGGSSAREGSALQIEVEVLPEFHGELLSPESGMQSGILHLLNDIRRQFAGVDDPFPKFISPKIQP